MDFVYYNSLFGVDFMFRKGRASGQFEKECRRLRKIFLQDGGMEDDLFLCRKCIQFPSKAVKISVYDICTSVLCALEDGMLYEVGYSAVESLLIACAASYTQCAVAYG